MSKSKKLMKYTRKVPHAVHDAKKLSRIMHEYID